MEKPENYEMTQTEAELEAKGYCDYLDKLFFYDNFHLDARDITTCIFSHMAAADLKKFMKFAGELREAYRHRLSLFHFNQEGGGQKIFNDMDPETQESILLAALIQHSIAYSQTRRESSKAYRRACDNTRVIVAGFIDNDN